MSSMFNAAVAFNQPVGAWDTSKVTTMANMFQGATVFNQPLGAWNTGLVNSMASMFVNAKAFNQPIGTWNTAKVTNMYAMFQSAAAFNQDIGTWNTAKVTNMYAMFQSAAAFNQDIGAWDTGAVTSMASMFYNAVAFNNGGSASINNWNTGLVTDMSSMFSSAAKFNQPIGAWNTGNVTTTANMFNGATVFNQPIGGWDTAKVTAMNSMFQSAVAFDQDISTWNMANVTAATNMLNAATAFSTPNYDKLLMSLDAQTLKPSVLMTSTAAKYCLGSTARASIISGDTWTITDGGYSCAAYQPVAMSTLTPVITENNTPPQTVGTLTATDAVPNDLDTYTYSLGCTVPGAQDSMFSLTGDQLSLTSTVDYEATPTLNVCVRVTNMLGQTYDNLYSFAVNNLLTLSYSGNGNLGGSAPAASETYLSGDTPVVAANTGSLTRTGYTFAGWNTAADGSGTSYAPGASITMNSDVMLYAVWNATPNAVADSAATTQNTAVIVTVLTIITDEALVWISISFT